jgi:hypothetical protein
MSHFDVPQEAVNWAKTCICLAEEGVKSYLQKQAFASVVELDPETGQQLTKIKLVSPLPIDVAGFLRNALVDTKHSFDQSLFAAAQTVGCVRFDKNYPWSQSIKGLKTIMEKRQRDRKAALPQIIVDEIFRQQPYATGEALSSGHDLIREIAHMVNNKHTIGFRAAASIESVTMTSVMIGGGSVFSNWDPVKEEMVLARTDPGSSFSYENCAVSTDVFFKRAGKIGEVSAVFAAKQFVDRAQIVLDGFKAACAKGTG